MSFFRSTGRADLSQHLFRWALVGTVNRSRFLQGGDGVRLLVLLGVGVAEIVQSLLLVRRIVLQKRSGGLQVGDGWDHLFLIQLSPAQPPTGKTCVRLLLFVAGFGIIANDT